MAGFARLILAIAVVTLPLVAQEHSDLQAELRSSTGSNRFQIGEVIPLEVVLSSSTSNRYLEPCALFRESNFGFPQCRFFSKWSFTIMPESGWVDLTKEFPSGPVTSGGPSFPVPDRDLSSQPEVFSYELTKRFRFDKPGEYHVRLSLDVGLDHETTQVGLFHGPVEDLTVRRTVTVTPEAVLEIVPASPEWQREIIRNGAEAYSAPAPPNANPPSAELLRYQRATRALCNLGTPDAARALVGLLSSSQQHQEIEYCLSHTPSADAAIKQMQRLLVDPDVAVGTALFSELVRLLGKAEFDSRGTYMIVQPAVDREREVLVSALPQKRGDAQVASLDTALHYPSRAKGPPDGFGYELPFAPPVIAAAVANFDKFPEQSQELLLGDGWARVRSPLMLPLVRRLAEASNGQALLRWLELDPAQAADFVRKEIVRPVPRFSSFYLRLPEPSLPAAQEAQLAANFVALTRDEDLFRAATLLHRYATAAVLPVVLPFIDARRAGWSCTIQYPVLAYLLKVSPAEAAPRVEELLRKTNQEPWQPTFFTPIGFLEPSPVLERLAMAQIEAGTQPLALDAIEYLQLHGSAAAKPFLWQQLMHWHEKLVASEAANDAKGATEKGTTQQSTTQQDATQKARTLANNEYSVLVRQLATAYMRAQAWLLSPDEADRLQALLGKMAAPLMCTFHCGGSPAIGPGPAYFVLYSANNPRLNDGPEYMNPAERLHYSINQYRCADMRALKEKILQLPAGSKFEFTYDFSAADQDELVEISGFLWSHGYKVRNPQNWSFLRPDSPQ
ncbi:MAG: hypothetical protein WA172_11875 [Terriglobales bacterium]